MRRYCFGVLSVSFVAPAAFAAGALVRDLKNPATYPSFVTDTVAGARVASYKHASIEREGPMVSEVAALYNGRASEPVRWETQDIAAANVFFHVHVAQRYFERLHARLGLEMPPVAYPVTVRVHMDVQNGLTRKFTEIPQHNRAVTTREGEVWFHIPRRIRARLPKIGLTGLIPPLHALKQALLAPTLQYPSDTAMLPTSVYHEWTHLMTAREFGTNWSTLMGEGYGRYFSAVIQGLPWDRRIAEFAHPKSAHYFDRPLWKPTERDESPGAIFVPTLFWAIRRAIPAQKADALIWLAKRHLDARSRLVDLRRALEAEIDDPATRDRLGLSPDEAERVRQLMRSMWEAQRFPTE